MKDKLRTFGTLRSIDTERMTVDAVISTGDIARDDAIIDPAGWDFTNYRRNPVVLFNHNDISGFPVARTVDGPTPTGSELTARAEFDMEDPEAARLFGKIQRGFVFSTSVRWLPKRWEFVKSPTADMPERTVLVFREQELLEWSFVNIPADPGAVILRADGDPLDITLFAPDQRSSLRPPEEDEDDDTETKEPPPEPRPDARIYAALEGIAGRLDKLIEARATPPDINGLIVAGLAKATGKSEERIRQELKAGQYA